MQSPVPTKAAAALAVAADLSSEPATPEFAHQVLQWSVAKITESRRRKGGIDLRHNLLLANVLCKARGQLIWARQQQMAAAAAAAATEERKRPPLKRSASVAVLEDEEKEAAVEAHSEAVQIATKRSRLEPVTEEKRLQQQQHQPQSQPLPHPPSCFSISIIPLSAAEAAKLSSSGHQTVVSLHLGGASEPEPFTWTALADSTRGGCVPTCA